MIAPATPALRQLALKKLGQHAPPDATAAALAAAARRAYDDLAGVLTPLIGQVGVESLTGRALHLTAGEYPCLIHEREAGRTEAVFDQVAVSLEGQEPALARAAAGAVLATLAGLVVIFLGQSLTDRLLRKAWPDAFSDMSRQESKA